ncbi:MAG: hypothetical protein ACK4GO_05520 [Gemmobacter sp.]
MTVAGSSAKALRVATKARIVIIEAGAAGTALVNRLVQRLEGAQITAIDARAEGGIALTTRPATKMKCAGAPMKHAFLIEDIASRTVGKA